jgi:uncharacterized protein involved in exopolysaccharide biosynthesis
MTSSPNRSPEDPVSIVLHAVTALFKRTWFLVGSTIAIGIVAAGVIVILPETFVSSATVLVSAKRDGTAGAMSMLKESGLGSLLGNIGGDDENMPVLRTLLGTRRLAIWATRKYKLDSVWTDGESKVKPMRIENQVRNWEGNFGWDELEDGGFELSFRSSSPELSRTVVYGVIGWLDSSFRAIARQNGAVREAYLDSRLAVQQRIVDSLQDSLAAFQIRNRLISPAVQMEGLAKGASDLEIEAERMDLEIRTLSASLGADNSKIRQLAYARDQTRSAANRLLERDDRSSLIKGLKSSVRGGIELQRKQKQLQVQVAIYSFLLQQKEQINLDISKDLPSLTVIDPPILPKKRASPPRFILMQAILILWILVACCWIVIGDVLRRSPLSEENRRAWMELLGALPLGIGNLIQRKVFREGTELR